jgi:TonB-dependent starch-binding outer membrane protein SusC
VTTKFSFLNYQIFKPNNFIMKQFLFTLLILFVGVSYSYSQRTVSGTVTDDAGTPLIGANIVAKEAAGVGTITDIDGKFKLQAPENVKTLIVSYAGYTSQEVDVTSTNVISVTLSEGRLLEELVIVGYGEKSTRFNTQAVSALGENSIKNRPVLSPQELLQGQAAGVQMVNSSGVLGAQSTLRIRGAASITGGGQPLFVVDGVPLNDDVRSAVQGGGTGLNPLMNINSNDIESMTVLKDAAAVAIYGSRGSNGVVLIKTKRGSKGETTTINVDLSSGTSEPTNLVTMMNTEQFVQYNTEWRAARNLAPQTLSTDYFNWPDAVVQKGKSNSVNLSASGGTEKTTYYMGGSFVKESGFTIGNESERLSGRINFDHKANNWLTVGTNLSISKVDMDRIGVENNTFAPLTSAYLQLPNVLPRNPDGTFRNTGFIQNVLAIEALNTNTFESTRTTGNVYADFKFVEGLVFRTDFGMDNAETTAKTRNVNLLTPGGSASRDISNDYKWLTTNTLRFDKEFDNNSSFGALAGYSFETSRFLNVFVAGNNFATDDLPNVASASTPTSTFEAASRWALESQFLRANYNLNNKYLIEGTVRRDGSSRFGANKRYGVFWAASAGWILSEESFMKNQSFFDLLKLTASYGTAGNDRIGDFSSLPLYGGGVASDYAGAPGLRPIQTPNPDLTWEETTQVDIGISTKFLDSRITLNANYYDKVTEGILLNVPYPFTTGFPSASQNVGRMSNSGIDLEINADILRDSDFKWSVGLNAGYLKNEVLELPNASVDPDGNRFVAAGDQRAVVGRSLNEFYLVRAKGVNPETGDFEWLDKAGNPTTTYSPNNRVYVGSAIPKYVGGLSTNFEYKGFDLNVLFNFSYGNMVNIRGLQFMENLNSAAGFNKSVTVLDYWKESGDNAFAPKLSSTTAPLFNQASTLHLQNGSFLRLRNVQLGYNLPTSILGKQNVVESARIFVLGQNLFLVKDKNFRGPDPEVSANGTNNQIQGDSFFALPQAKIITFGLNIQF